MSIKAVWLLLFLSLAIFGAVKYRRIVLVVALLQFPVNLYAVVALRSGNQAALEKRGRMAGILGRRGQRCC